MILWGSALPMIGAQHPAPPPRSSLPTITPMTLSTCPIAQSEHHAQPAQEHPAKPMTKHPPPHLVQDEPVSKQARMKVPQGEQSQLWGHLCHLRPPNLLNQLNLPNQPNHLNPHNQLSQPSQLTQPNLAQLFMRPAELNKREGPSCSPIRSQTTTTLPGAQADHNDIDWDYPLHAQLQPRLPGRPPRDMTESDPKAISEDAIEWTDEHWRNSQNDLPSPVQHHWRR